MEELLERSAELSAIRASAGHAAAGHGRALVIEAPAGIGVPPRRPRSGPLRIKAVLSAHGGRHVVGTIVVTRG